MSEPTEAPVVKVAPSGKAQSDFFTAVRERGLLNTMLEAPAAAYEKSNPGMKCKWERWPKDGDSTMVTAREGQGYQLVEYSHIPGTATSPKQGVVRVGDMVLMAANETIHQMIQDADAQAARDDVKLPERAYRENLESKKVRRTDGKVDYAKPVGTVRHSVEAVVPPTTSTANEGGED